MAPTLDQEADRRRFLSPPWTGGQGPAGQFAVPVEASPLARVTIGAL